MGVVVDPESVTGQNVARTQDPLYDQSVEMRPARLVRRSLLLECANVSFTEPSNASPRSQPGSGG
jgi:hypothetical protein